MVHFYKNLICISVFRPSVIRFALIIVLLKTNKQKKKSICWIRLLNPFACLVVFYFLLDLLAVLCLVLTLTCPVSLCSSSSAVLVLHPLLLPFVVCCVVVCPCSRTFPVLGFLVFSESGFPVLLVHSNKSWMFGFRGFLLFVHPQMLDFVISWLISIKSLLIFYSCLLHPVFVPVNYHHTRTVFSMTHCILIYNI